MIKPFKMKHDGRDMAGALVLVSMLMSAGCAYRLPVFRPPFQQQIKVVARNPENYVLRLGIIEPHDYHVPGDGRVTLDIPSYRAACSGYLIDKILVRPGADPFSKKRIDVVVGGKITRQLSLKDISRLPTDSEGYHLLRVRTVQ